jgi:hypothetical protein
VEFVLTGVDPGGNLRSSNRSEDPEHAVILGGRMRKSSSGRTRGERASPAGTTVSDLINDKSH